MYYHIKGIKALLSIRENVYSKEFLTTFDFCKGVFYMTNYQHMTKIQNVNKPWHTMYIYPHAQYKIGDIIGYMWDDWKVIEVYT